jgi:choline dehydrogenase
LSPARQRGWSWDDVLPYFEKAGNWEGAAGKVHGKDGPLFTSLVDRSSLLCAAVIAAGRETGVEYRDGVNNLRPGAGDSIGWCQQTRGGRRRASAARTYLHPAMKRPNLQVLTKALVRRILFDGKRAIGVEFERGGVVERAEPDREVILSAGGRGLAAHPAALGCRRPRASQPCRHRGLPRLDGGRAEPAGPLYRPHQLSGPRAWRRSRALTRHPARRRGAALSRYRQGHIDLQRLARRGLGQGARGPPTCSAASSPAASRTARSAELDDFPGIRAAAWQMRPLSRGYVEARSPNPAQAPAINLRYLSDPTDRRAMIGGLRFIRRLFAAPAVVRYCGAEILPGAAVESDDELLDYARQKGSTAYHATCTCRWAATGSRSSTTSCACTGSRASGSSTPR